MNDTIADKTWGVGHRKMPARETTEYRGLEFRVGPDFLLRRIFPFPFYFESTNPSFRVAIKRVSESPPGDDWKGGVIQFDIELSDGSLSVRRLPVPDLRIGESTKLILKNIYSHVPGQTRIRLPRERLDEDKVLLSILYSYKVRTEEQLWIWTIGPLLGLLVGTGTTLLGVLIQSWLS